MKNAAKTLFTSVLVLSLALFIPGCDEYKNSSDTVQQDQQETMLKEATAQVPMPGITKWRERKMFKLIYEMRDQEITTYTYAFSQMLGKFVFIGRTIGYPVPYSTQYTSPSKAEWRTGSANGGYGWVVLPQADPNSLFSPASSDATYVMMKVEGTSEIFPFYCEDKLSTYPRPLPARLVVDSEKLDIYQRKTVETQVPTAPSPSR
ncbi:MAG: hypothetical protein WC797_04690 [Candidatus Paceibacterota bacterium]